MRRRRVKTSNGTTVALGVFFLGSATFEIRRGLLATVGQVDAAAPQTIKTAYAGLAAKEGLDPRAEHRRRAVAYALQRAWHEANGRSEPAVVRARREALYAAMRIVPVASDDVTVAAGAASVAALVRNALIAGASTDEVLVATRLAAPTANVNARVVAYYRHQLRKTGVLPPARRNA